MVWKSVICQTNARLRRIWHYLLCRHYSGARRALAWRHPLPAPLSCALKQSAAFLVAAVTNLPVSITFL